MISDMSRAQRDPTIIIRPPAVSFDQQDSCALHKFEQKDKMRFTAMLLPIAVGSASAVMGQLTGPLGYGACQISEHRHPVALCHCRVVRRAELADERRDGVLEGLRVVPVQLDEAKLLAPCCLKSKKTRKLTKWFPLVTGMNFIGRRARPSAIQSFTCLSIPHVSHCTLHKEARPWMMRTCSPGKTGGFSSVSESVTVDAMVCSPPL